MATESISIEKENYPEAIKDWDKLTADEKKPFTRQMEVFAGYAEYTDTEIGRLVGAITDMGELDSTLIFYIVEDYGIPAPSKFTGKIDKVTIDLKEMEKAERKQEDKLRAEASRKAARSN